MVGYSDHYRFSTLAYVSVKKSSRVETSLCTNTERGSVGYQMKIFSSLNFIHLYTKTMKRNTRLINWNTCLVFNYRCFRKLAKYGKLLEIVWYPGHFPRENLSTIIVNETPSNILQLLIFFSLLKFNFICIMHLPNLFCTVFFISTPLHVPAPNIIDLFALSLPTTYFNFVDS